MLRRGAFPNVSSLPGTSSSLLHLLRGLTPTQPQPNAPYLQSLPEDPRAKVIPPHSLLPRAILLQVPTHPPCTSKAVLFIKCLLSRHRPWHLHGLVQVGMIRPPRDRQVAEDQTVRTQATRLVCLHSRALHARLLGPLCAGQAGTPLLQADPSHLSQGHLGALRVALLGSPGCLEPSPLPALPLFKGSQGGGDFGAGGALPRVGEWAAGQGLLLLSHGAHDRKAAAGM